MELLKGWHKLITIWSPLLIVLVYLTVFTSARSHHIRHHRDRFKRQQGAHLYLPGSFVQDNYDPEAGPWLDWSSPSPCTRTCGGGVSTQHRACTPGYNCQGPSKRHFSCNTQDCPDISDFRSQQCSEFDSKPFENVYYQWIPYTKSPQECELNCMPRGERFYYRHKLTVIDGTRCNDESLDVCVEGTCQHVGCDMMLGSQAKEDNCRVCGGDGSTCNTLTGLLDMQDLQVGYNDILLIPAGAVNIVIREIKPSNNYLAVRNTAGDYYLNGNWRIDFPRTLDFAGCKFHYDRYPQGFSAPDSLSCQGPIEEAVFIVLLYQDVNVGIEYEYSTPKSIAHPAETETYAWTFDQFSPCSASCGGGYQYRNVSCAGRKTLEPASSNLCDANNKPIESQRCGEDPCAPEWVAKEWEACSAPCGENGTQTRKVLCEQIISGGVPSIVDDQQCANIQKPASQQPCNQGVVCAEWHTGPWKPCDVLCGDGKETRKITCFRKEKGKIIALEDADCAHVERPETERKCMIRPCEGVDWVASEWSGCEGKCGLSEETRKVQCATAAGKVFEDKLCEEAEERPPTSRKCETQAKDCEFEWFASQWSECSAKCGSGVQTRRVFCTSPTDDGFKKVENDKCDPEKKYDESKNCTAKETECAGEWFTGPWSKCSKECGGGIRERRVICMRGNDTVSIKDCDQNLTPFSNEDCNKQSCDKEEPKATTAVTDESSAATAPIKEHPDTEVELVEDYELVDDDECEDGEFVVVDTSGKPQLTDKDKLISLGTSTELGKEQKETTLALDELMMSDSTYVSDASSSFSPDYGSGDYDFSKASTIDIGSTAFDSSLITEGSGDESTYFKSTSGYSTGTDFEGSGSTPIEVTEEIISKVSAYSLSGEFTTESAVTDSSSDGVSEISTDKETLSTDDDDEVSSTPSHLSSEPTTEGGSEATDTTDASSETTTDASTEADTASTDVYTTTEAETSTEAETTTEGETTTESESTTETETTTEAETTTDVTDSTTELDTTDITTESATESTTDSDTASTDASTAETTTDASTDTTIGASEEASPSSAVSEVLPGEFGGDDEISTEESKSAETTTDGSTDVTTEGSTVESETTTEGTEQTSEGTTEISGATDESSTVGSTDVTAESGSTITEGSTFSGATDESEVTEVSGSTEAGTTESGSTESGSTESGTTESGTTESGISESGSTESGTTESGTTESGITDISEASTTESGTTEVSTSDEWSTMETTTQEWEDVFIPKGKSKMCKRKKKTPCKSTTFGCCSDKVTPAQGPFDQGCPTPKTCKETKYGCCEDEVSPAQGKNFKGCPPSQCKETLFGCCPDNKTPAEGNDNEGCPPPPPACLKSKYGCCSDNVTEAKGPDGKGCKVEEEITTETGSTIPTTTEYEDCSISTYGCCPDGIYSAQGEYFKGCDIFKENCRESYFGCCPDGKTSAQSPNYGGCETECSKSAYGCCPDGITPAHGYTREGCCLSSQWGCCPDNIQEAKGPDFEGCGCQHSPYGCCPDNTTNARGYHNEGCGCEYTEHGCCPDNYTPAAGPEYAGCLCHTFQFGCCPDGITHAKGPHQQGCGCRNTEFGCCSDEETPAKGANFEGCDCSSSKFGCCLDGVTEAQDDNFEGCTEKPENMQASCSLEKERGPCRNYTVKWFYDMAYGGCSRFWYGGCDGNENRFKEKAECHDTCVEPTGKDRCNLPMVKGPCEGYYPEWYYDQSRGHCAQFIYGGCLGNNNRFETAEECNSLCVRDSNIDPCEQPKEEGPCRGNYYRWFYSKEEGSCQPFRYGGCQGNNNNFHTEEACKQKCAEAGRKKEHCSLPRAQGNCTERQSRWYYDATEKRCMPFYYSGCHGNNNNFISLEQCEADCPKDIVKDTCHLPAETGECSNYTERWYFDTARKSCQRFYYGSCGGNENNFQTEDACLQRCSTPAPTEPPQPAEPDQQPPTQTERPTDVAEPFRYEFCALPAETGPCRASHAKWFYDSGDGACKQFLYGGCEGNRNNFETAEECQQSCENSQDICSLPKVVGPCAAEYDMWYYNSSTDACELFKFGGCLGNANRFNDQESCEQRCRRAPPTVTQAPEVQPPVEDATSICYKPVDSGNCTDNVPSYYYEGQTRRCIPFTYSGCGGNANRYSSEEQCERQCGKFRGQDVCSLPMEAGPCATYHSKYYYDNANGRCDQFYYGGCEGNGNRFSTVEECQSICVTREETKPEQPSSQICLLPADTGNCREGHHKRWYFDEQKGECIVFIYSGCGGNFNRFKSFQSCIDTCREYMAPILPETPTSESSVAEHPCQRYMDECKTMLCPYGIKAYVDDTQCNRCKCFNPCDDIVCPEGTQCGVDVNLERTDVNDPNFIGVCRDENKPGECPSLQSRNATCDQECRTDADCTSEMKCCSNGCGTVCVLPFVTTVSPPAELRTTAPVVPYTEAPYWYSAPQVIEESFEPVVQAGEGDIATLKCAIHGNPKPTFTWHKENLLIDGKEPRYRILLDGSALQIISLYKTDSGIYLCSADNKIGQPLTKEIRLEVLEPVEKPARILNDTDLSTVTVSLGSPATLNCFVYGYPQPVVTWWKDTLMIPFKDEEYTINKDLSLVINAVKLRNLGVYTCQAYNGKGKPASWAVTVRALGPVHSTDPNDQKYMDYVINRPERPETTPQPQYPFRPTRDTPPAITHTTPRYIHPTTTPPRVFTVPVRANITIKDTKFPAKSDVSIPCDVDGYPVPEVKWYKDDILVQPSDRIQITESNRLIIRNAKEGDSGEYKCEAKNQYSSANSITPLLIEGRAIHPNCTDNPFFADCKLIVKGNFCKHNYYARFCCHSCTEAGQLDPYGPHLQDQPASIDSNLV